MSKLGKHKSVDKELRRSLIWLESLVEVKKVVLGRCESARHAYAPGTLRHRRDVAGGFKLNAYGGNGVIDVFVKVNSTCKEGVLKSLKEKWDV